VFREARLAVAEVELPHADEALGQSERALAEILLLLTVIVINIVMF